MKHSILLAAFAFTFTFSDCNQTRQVQRIDPNQVVDLSGRWNDVDAKLVGRNDQRCIDTSLENRI